jgi:hypothetical protein
MRKYLHFLPLGFIPLGLTALVFVLRVMHQPQVPTVLHKSFQSFMGVMMLLMQF